MALPTHHTEIFVQHGVRQARNFTAPQYRETFVRNGRKQQHDKQQKDFVALRGLGQSTVHVFHIDHGQALAEFDRHRDRNGVQRRQPVLFQKRQRQTARGHGGEKRQVQIHHGTTGLTEGREGRSPWHGVEGFGQDTEDLQPGREDFKLGGYFFKNIVLLVFVQCFFSFDKDKGHKGHNRTTCQQRTNGPAQLPPTRARNTMVTRTDVIIRAFPAQHPLVPGQTLGIGVPRGVKGSGRRGTIDVVVVVVVVVVARATAFTGQLIGVHTAVHERTTDKIIGESTGPPMPGQGKQFGESHAVVVGTIGPGWAWCTVVVDVLIKQRAFAQARGSIAVAGGGARGTIVVAGGTIGFGRFARLVQIGIGVTFFAGRFTFAVLVLPGGACRTILTGN